MRLLYPDVLEVEAVAWREDGRLVFGQKQDYRMRDNEVLWAPGRGPEAGSAVTFRYLAPAAYVVDGAAPVYRHEGDAVYPYKAVTNRLDKVQIRDLR
jgi:hypothetical protein